MTRSMCPEIHVWWSCSQQCRRSNARYDSSQFYRAYSVTEFGEWNQNAIAAIGDDEPPFTGLGGSLGLIDSSRELLPGRGGPNFSWIG